MNLLNNSNIIIEDEMAADKNQNNSDVSDDENEFEFQDESEEETD